jgi:hypothetical protein
MTAFGMTVERWLLAKKHRHRSERAEDFAEGDTAHGQIRLHLRALLFRNATESGIL